MHNKKYRLLFGPQCISFLKQKKMLRSYLFSATNEMRHLFRGLYLFGVEKLSVRNVFRQVRSL